MAIPKIIHYCWFGGHNKPDFIQKYINTWRNLRGFKIIEWNENNIDFNSHPYLKKAYDQKKYAFVSDYVRLKVLYDIGGIYLDTDVEVKKDLSEFLNHSFFMGFMYDCLLGTAVIGAEKGSKIVKDILGEYDTLELKDIPNNSLYTKYILNKFPSFRLNNECQVLEKGIVIYPKENFERPTFNKKLGYTVHHYTASWKKKKKSTLIKRLLKILIGDVLYKKIVHKNALRKTPFYNIYLEHKKIIDKGH